MRGTIVAFVVFAALAVVVTVVVSRGTRVPDGPVPIAWDREPCAHCHMQIGEPRHAVQLITTDGAVASFDDVGCAIEYLRQHRPAVHRLWFHGEGETWLGTDVVGFVATEITPMGSGLLAVDRRAADARTFEQVLETFQAPSAPGAPP